MTILLASLVGFQGVFNMGSLTNTLSQDAVVRSERGKVGSKARRPLLSTAALRFTPSKTVRAKTAAAVADSYLASNPQLAKEMKADFAKHDPIAEMAPELRKVGLDPQNLGDAMALYLVQAWYGVRGKVASRPADYHAVSRQWRDAIRRVPGFARLSNADKQQLGESMILYGGLAESFVKLAQKQRDPARLETVKANLRREAQAHFNLDLAKLRLGPNGLY